MEEILSSPTFYVRFNPPEGFKNITISDWQFKIDNLRFTMDEWQFLRDCCRLAVGDWQFMMDRLQVTKDEYELLTACCGLAVTIFGLSKDD